jgi:NADH-quinone oxidoreductase subunit G
LSPERQLVTLVVDGVEVDALEGTMLVDAAKEGDVEIPVFCYEPKLGQPVGACRICLVEVEGIPKLQTACSTPVRDGMVVYTQTDRVVEAQNAVVEFLLVNHPLDCPVCDKGGECPLQDIAMGWGPGRSRFSDPKRHFQKPLPLSPLIRIDRERCILCYRCVRFSQEVAEDEQLQLLERGDRSYVGTFDDRPYIAPFHGNIIELCPVGALTSEQYRFRARPWDIEDAGSLCTLCPSQCNVKYTVRDERVMRVLARDNSGVDDGWLCDKGRFGYQMLESPARITTPMLRQGGALRPAGWREAIEAAAAGLRAARERTAALVGGGSSNEEGYLVQRIVRAALGSPHVDSRRGAGASRWTLLGLADARLGARISDLDEAETVLVLGGDPLHEMPILDLRIRKATRRHNARLIVASERPTSLDGGAEAIVRYAPGDAADLIAALASASRGEAASGPYAEQAERAGAALGRDSNLAVVWSERIARGPNGAAALDSLLELAAALGLDQRDGSGLIGVPEETNGRGLQEVGCLPDAGPGLAEAPVGRDSTAIRDALESGELSAALLVNVDPVRDYPDGPGWERALQSADFVVSVSMFEDASTRRADVVFPAEGQAEKDGSVTHPDGRLQRLRQAVPHPGEVRHGWQVLVELSAALGHELDLHTLPDVFAALAAEVPFYPEIHVDELGGQGVRWQETEQGSDWSGAGAAGAPLAAGEGTEGVPAPAGGNGLVLGTYRDLWSGEVTERNPALRFLAPKQTLELAPADAERLGVANGEQVSVRANGSAVDATVAIRDRLRPGAGFLIEGTKVANANAIPTGAPVEVNPVESE